ncbi:MAG: biopolymer transporter ExbD [Verrucomicrobiales bacterium]|jgi:biopolymer transport protein ExbD|nr:biopolymer transporter ExbD [Verrucomicrobiales bacterium]
MIKKNAPRTRDDSPGLDISSLIDVSFLLLIYFLITSTLDPREGDIGLTMPGKYSEPGSTFDFDPAIIEIDSAGVVSLLSEVLETNTDSRTLSVLEDRLRIYQEAAQLQNKDENVRVEVHVDDAVSGQRFMDVMNCLAGLGITKISLADFERE